MTDEPADLSTRELRAGLADAINDAIRGRTTFITQRGRRVAGMVPLSVAEGPAAPSRDDEVAAVLAKHGKDEAGLAGAVRAAILANPTGFLAALEKYWPEKRAKGRPKRP